MSSAQNMDMNLLLQNLKDLDGISKSLFQNIQDKNKILQESINDSQTYLASIDNNKKISNNK